MNCCAAQLQFHPLENRFVYQADATLPPHTGGRYHSGGTSTPWGSLSVPTMLLRGVPSSFSERPGGLALTLVVVEGDAGCAMGAGSPAVPSPTPCDEVRTAGPLDTDAHE
jgi:hypothetical protein